MNGTVPNVLDADGPVYRVLSRWTELIILSLIWLALSLPVITAPAATGWLLRTVRRTRDGQPIPGFTDTIGELRLGFGISVRLAALQVAVAVLIVIALFGPSPGGWYGQLVLIVGSLVGITMALVAPWSVVLLAEHRTVRGAVRAAYRRALGQLSLAFLSAVSVIAGAGAVLFVPGWIRLIALIAMPGLVAAVVTRLCDRAGTRSPHPTTDHRLREAMP
jgi:hypothetical protein